MSMIDKDYLVVINGKPEGPFSFQEIEKMQLKPSDFLKATGAKDFKELREIPELSNLLGVQYQPTLPQYFATMDMRLLAWAIDFLISFAVFCVLIFLPISLFSPPENKLQFTLIGLLAVIPIHFFMSVFMESSPKQGSFGKNMLNIRVCDTQGLRISLGRAFLRNIFKIIGFLSLGLGFFMGFLDKRQQCWHDKLAGTLVVKDRLI